MRDDQSSTRDRAWDLKLLQRELSQLQREKTHLTSKSLQRPLNSWEKFRLTVVFRDSRSLALEISRITKTHTQERQFVQEHRATSAS